jgi:hypothetical protein
MAIGWLTVLKNVPWGEVISNAPKVADGAKKLWSSVGKKPPVAQPAADSTPPSAVEAQTLAELQARLATLETAASDLHVQMLASSELIKALADQNALLIKGIDASRIRLRWLSGAVIVMGGAVAAGLLWWLTR